MPQIPTFDDDVTVHPGGGGQVSPGALAAPGAALARGGAELEDEFQQWNNRYQEARRASDGSNIMAGLSTKLNDAAFRWGKTPDRNQAIAGFDAETAQMRKESVDTISDPFVRSYVNNRFNAEADGRQLEAGNRAYEMESSARAGDLDRNTTAFAESMAGTGNEALRAKIHDDALGAIKSAVAGGWISPEEGVKRELKFGALVQEVSALKLIDHAEQTQNPDDANTASRALADPQQFKGMEPDARERLQTRLSVLHNTLATRAVADQDRRDRLEDKQHREAQAQNAVSIIANVHNGGAIDDGALEKMARGQLLSPEGLEAVYAAKRQVAEGVDDPTVLAHLTDQVENRHATPEDVFGAMTSRKISTRSGIELLKTINRGVVSAPEKAALDTLNTVLKENNQFGFKDPAGAAQAQLEFHRRVNAGEDPQAILPELVTKYVPDVKAPIWLDRPRLGAVPDAASLNNIAAATVKAHVSHQMDDAQYSQQVQLLESYKRFFESRARMDALTGGLKKPAAGKPADAGARP